MNENDIRQIVQDEIKKAAQTAQYGVTRVPVHTHNNIDSPNLSQHSVIGFTALDGVANGVANPQLLNGQALIFGDASVSTPYTTYTNIYNYALPVIYGYGTATDQTLTGTPSSGATSATLTGNWAGTTGNYAAQFSNGEIRIVKLTNGATTVTWTYPLQHAGGGTDLNVIANSRFHGGTAPYGTALIFRNDDDGVLQLWVRTQAGVITDTWASVDLTLSVAD